MSLPVDPYTFANGATADGVQVNSRFNALFAALSAGGLDPTVFAASALTSREVGLDTVSLDIGSTGQSLSTSAVTLTGATFAVTPATASYLLVAVRVGLTVIASAGASSAASVSLLDNGALAALGSTFSISPQTDSVTAAGTSLVLARVALSAALHTFTVTGTAASGSAQVTGRTQIMGLLVAQ